jgi:hypothetical protein
MPIYFAGIMKMLIFYELQHDDSAYLLRLASNKEAVEICDSYGNTGYETAERSDLYKPIRSKTDYIRSRALLLYTG